MNKKIFLILPVLLVVFALGATAANPFNLKFPIPELGNCGSFDQCKTYCDEPSHADACLSFGEKQGLIKKEEVGQAKKFTESLNNGDVPVDGCTDEDSCKTLCNLPENREACFAWAKDHGFVGENENNNIGVQGPSNEPGIDKEKALQAIKANGGPGGCSSFEECGKFCSKPDNQKVCFEYAKKYNLMSEEEAKRAERFMSQPGPGGCRGEECKTYCENQDHHQECLKFAVDNGFMTQAQADRVEKFINLHQNLQNFGGPGGCKGENECRQYCSDPSHIKECNNFAQKAGLINPEEARKHIQDFENFKKEHDFENQNSESEDQLNQGPQDEQNQEGQNQEGPTENFQSGPGGCQGPEKCIKYCSDPQNKEECAKFFNQQGQHGELKRQGQGQEGEHGMNGMTGTPPPYSGQDHSKDCAAHGGVWTGSYCQMPNQPSLPTLPSSINPPATTDYAKDCAARGGIWNGSVCQLPNQPSPSPSVSVICLPRPTCLDTVPRCLVPEPVGGWCPTSTPPVIPTPTAPTPTPLPTRSLIQSLIRFLSL